MASKAEIPLYRETRLSRPVCFKRTKPSAAQKRNCCSFWSVIVLVALCFGTFLGTEHVQVPDGGETALRTGISLRCDPSFECRARESGESALYFLCFVRRRANKEINTAESAVRVYTACLHLQHIYVRLCPRLVMASHFISTSH